MTRHVIYEGVKLCINKLYKLYWNINIPLNSSEVVGFVPVQDTRIDSEMRRSILNLEAGVMNTLRLEGQREHDLKELKRWSSSRVSI